MITDHEITTLFSQLAVFKQTKNLLHFSIFLFSFSFECSASRDKSVCLALCPVYKYDPRKVEYFNLTHFRAALALNKPNRMDSTFFQMREKRFAKGSDSRYILMTA